MIDFKEIPTANSGSGQQDFFELFARDFLTLKGFEIIINPARGADGGVDLIVRESREGKNEQKTEVDWLVSCKHYAHSSKSISSSIESDILDRVKSNKCHGFIAFYSTLPSSGLSNKLEGLKESILYQVFDLKKIEQEIVGFPSMESLFIRYFPESYKKWKKLVDYREPTFLFNYYIENEFNHEIKIFKSILGSTDNILRAIRNTDSFVSFIQYDTVKIIIENTDSEIDKLVALKNDPSRKNRGDFLIKEMDYLYDKLLLPFLSKKYSIKLYPKTMIMGRNFTRGETNGVYLLFPNALFLNEPEYNGLKSLYEKLVKLI